MSFIDLCMNKTFCIPPPLFFLDQETISMQSKSIKVYFRISLQNYINGRPSKADASRLNTLINSHEFKHKKTFGNSGSM